MDGSKFCVEKLRSGGYESWRFKIEMLLIRENLWKHVTQAAPNPLTDPWKEGDAKARATIALLVDDSQHPLIRNCKTAGETWKALESHHQKTTMCTRVSVLKKLCKAEYRDDGDMEGHLFRMDELFASLANAGQELESSLKVAMVLTSMPDSFDTLTTALESRSDEELTMELVKRKLLDEAQKRAEKSHHGETILRAGGNKGSIICHRCNKPGHMKRECPLMKSGKESNNQPSSSGRKSNPAPKSKSAKIGKVSSFAFVANCDRKLSKAWIVDSGATSHMCADRTFFDELRSSSGISITLADGNETHVKGIGSGKLLCCDDQGEEHEVILSEVYYVPELESNLISVSRLVSKGAEVIFSASSGCIIKSRGMIAAVARKSCGLYYLKIAKEQGMHVTEHPKDCVHVWHRRLGHRDPEAIQRVVREDLATGVAIRKCDIHRSCECCAQGKLPRQPFPKKATQQSSKVLDLVHSDICGPMNTTSPGGSRYFLTIIDDFSRYTMVYFLKRKSEAIDRIEDYVNMVHNRFGRNPMIIRSDQGGEYKARRLGQFYRANGIVPQYTASYTPQQNGVAERKNRTIVEMARCMLIDAKMDHRFWAEAVNTAVHLQNMLPSRSIEKTPHELWFGKKPDYRNLHRFGCAAFVHVPKVKRTKLEPKAIKLTFVGYSDHHKAFRFIDQATNEVVISRDARFVEEEEEADIQRSQPSPTVVVEYESVTTQDTPDEDDASADESDDESTVEEEETPTDSDSSLYDSTCEIEEDEEVNTAEIATPRRSSRSTKGMLPERYREMTGMVRRVIPEPRTYKEAIESPEAKLWIAAMDEEIKSLTENHTWTLTNLPENRKAVGCKWIYKRKLDEDGNIVRYKARLVAQGFSQMYGTDFDEVFAPVVRQVTFRTLLTVAGQRNMLVKHADVKTAYLHGEMEEAVFMKQPLGYEAEDTGAVCLLKKGLYGLRQSGCIWNKKIDGVLKQIGFLQSANDPCLYVRSNNEGNTYLVIYVDDIVIACHSEEEYDNIMRDMNKHFTVTSLGNIRHFLGIQVQQDGKSFTLNQKSYIQKLLLRFGMDQAKPSKYPLDPGHLKQKEEKEMLQNNHQYASLIGSLLYVAVNTRPDIAVSVSILCRSVSAPSQADWTEAKRILRYLKSTLDHKLTLKAEEHRLEVYVDADWASDAASRKSNSGYVFLFGGGPIFWGSRKQTCIALSSTEAEFVALAECCQELTWIVRLLQDFSVDVPAPVLIHEDNQSCIKQLESTKINNRSKHVDTKYHFVRKLHEEGLIDVRYCPTDQMVADMLTKPLTPQKLTRFREAIGVQQSRRSVEE